MTTTAKSGGSRKRAAASAEKNGKPKTIKFRGIALILPPELGCEVGYAYAELEGADDQLRPLIAFIESLIGVEQMAAVKAKQIADGVTFTDLAQDLAELLEQVYAEYGTSVGEASASPTS